MTSNQKNNQQDIRRNGAAQQANRNQVVIYCIIFIIGFLAGVAFTIYKGNISAPGSVPSVDGQAQAHNEETRKAILNLEAEVTANPQNHQAWTRLGNLYYDTEQPDKAIVAYTKSLELHKGDANIITDLGVMYRLVNQPQKAIEQFERAMQQDPTHLPSRYNKGIVLLYDLNDPKGAIASWEEILKIDPEAKAGNGEPIRDLIEKIKAEQTTPK